MSRWGIPVFGVLVLCLLGTGCGVDQREEASSAVVNGFLSALDDGDVGSACALLAPSTLESLSSGGEPCEPALNALGLRAGEIRDTSVWGDRALVHTDRDTMFLVELDAGWRIAAAGCSHQQEDIYQCTLESS